ncbi:MAG: 2-C-methyl-D-erythritol 2,4-cyclodiphosphate synthase, partial [Planctomycetota bacterium]
MRIGLGYDNHRLEEGRPMWIGGLEIPSPVGEVAHSDGDVLLHALTDALLGAIAAGDIGEHFPDTDPRWKGQASHVFVREAARIVRDAGYSIVNVDATVILEKVK